MQKYIKVKYSQIYYSRFLINCRNILKWKIAKYIILVFSSNAEIYYSERYTWQVDMCSWMPDLSIARNETNIAAAPISLYNHGLNFVWFSIGRDILPTKVATLAAVRKTVSCTAREPISGRHFNYKPHNEISKIIDRIHKDGGN